MSQTLKFVISTLPLLCSNFDHHHQLWNYYLILLITDRPLLFLDNTLDVAPIRKLKNIIYDTLIFCDTTNNMASNNNVVMGGSSFDLLFDNIYDNYDDVHGCSLTHSTYSP